MKILHINAIPDGGAGWCAIRINNALKKEGVNSRMLFRDGKDLPDGVDGDLARRDVAWLDRHRFVQRGLHFANRIFSGVSTPYSRRLELSKAIARSGEKVYAHLPFSSYTNISHHPLVKWADVIHLHWVPEFVDYPTFFNQVKKPIVWTLHDMHPVRGVMHFESEYTKRPSALDKIDAYCMKVKQTAVAKADIHPVAISQMMKEIITSSDILGKFDCELIHNGVEVDAFKRHEVQRKSGLNFLFSSYGLFDNRKGLLRIIKAIESLGLSDVTLFCVGQNFDREALPKSSINIRHLGFITDTQLLSQIYSSVDCFINASYEEAFAQTPLESMSCGTPVISTPCSGAEDLIRDFNGVVCDGFTPEDLSAAIRLFLSRRYDHDTIRQHIVENYSYDIIARQYISLYEKVLSK